MIYVSRMRSKRGIGASVRGLAGALRSFRRDVRDVKEYAGNTGKRV